MVGCRVDGQISGSDRGVIQDGLERGEPTFVHGLQLSDRRLMIRLKNDAHGQLPLAPHTHLKPLGRLNQLTERLPCT